MKMEDCGAAGSYRYLFCSYSTLFQLILFQLCRFNLYVQFLHFFPRFIFNLPYTIIKINNPAMSMSMRLYHPDGIGSTAHQPTKNTLIRSPLQSNQNQISKIKSNQIVVTLLPSVGILSNNSLYSCQKDGVACVLVSRGRRGTQLNPSKYTCLQPAPTKVLWASAG